MSYPYDLDLLYGSEITTVHGYKYGLAVNTEDGDDPQPPEPPGPEHEYNVWKSNTVDVYRILDDNDIDFDFLDPNNATVEHFTGYYKVDFSNIESKEKRDQIREILSDPRFVITMFQKIYSGESFGLDDSSKHSFDEIVEGWSNNWSLEYNGGQKSGLYIQYYVPETYSYVFVDFVFYLTSSPDPLTDMDGYYWENDCIAYHQDWDESIQSYGSDYRDVNETYIRNFTFSPES